jgi:MoaA/NifB/PqqE/SkfB family radical SAM enzyme
MNYERVCALLALRGVSHRLYRALGRFMPPRALTLTITRQCNSHCIMCDIWRLHLRGEELALDDITRFLGSPSFSRLVELDLTGGEPFLRKDLTELIARVVRLKRQHLKALKTVALATNGLLPQLVFATVREILEIIAGEFDLAMICSLDGFGEKHDQIRGTPGAYRNVRHTIEQLQTLASDNPSFWLGVKTTILPLNWDQLPALADFARENGLFHILSPVLFTRERFRNLAKEQELGLLPEYRQGLIALYCETPLRDAYYSHAVVDTLQRGRRNIPCTAATDHFFVEGDGRVFPCPVMNISLGHIGSHSLDDILASPLRKRAAHQAGRSGACRLCLEPGCIRFSQAAEGFSFLRFILGDRGRDRFDKAYNDEGLSKYF